MAILTILFLGEVWTYLEMGWKSHSFSELNGLFCGSLEDKSVERSNDKEDLACEASEGSNNFCLGCSCEYP